MPTKIQYHKTFLIVCVVLLFNNLAAQNVYYDVSSPATRFTERNEILGNQFSKDLQTAVKPFLRASAVSTMLNEENNKSIFDKFNSSWMQTDNPELRVSLKAEAEKLLRKKLLNLPFYKYKGFFYGLLDKDYSFFINPTINTGRSIFENAGGNILSQNTRGAELRGSIGGKLGFYTYLTDNQTYFTKTIEEYIAKYGVIPGEGFWKKFNNNGMDFFNAKGYITFQPIKKIMNMQFGNDRNFIGNGYRSLILSDFSKDYMFLKVNTHVGAIEYQNLFANLKDYQPLYGNNLLPSKYMALHRLGINLFKKLNIGLNEMIIFDRSDSTSNGGFDLEYLNPVIFYRAVESNLGSRDNALMAFDWKYIFLKHFSFYGQFILDEFKLKYIKEKSDWWGNKNGWQLGMKYLNVAGIANLDAQVEVNQVRPYTYSHSMSSQSFSHYNQALAHPLDANFREMVGNLRYQPTKKLYLQFTGMYAQKGADSSDGALNYGGNLRLSSETRTSEFGVKFLQGVKQTITGVAFQANYMLKHNLFLDFSFMMKNISSAQAIQDIKEQYISFGLRLNIWPVDRMF